MAAISGKKPSPLFGGEVRARSSPSLGRRPPAERQPKDHPASHLASVRPRGDRSVGESQLTAALNHRQGQYSLLVTSCPAVGKERRAASSSFWSRQHTVQTPVEFQGKTRTYLQNGNRTLGRHTLECSRQICGPSGRKFQRARSSRGRLGADQTSRQAWHGRALTPEAGLGVPSRDGSPAG